MAMRSPVRGFLPSRAGRSFLVNLPKPTMETSSSRASASAMASNTPPTAAWGRLFRDTRLASHALDDLCLLHSRALLFLRMNSGMAREPLPPLLRRDRVVENADRSGA